MTHKQPNATADRLRRPLSAALSPERTDMGCRFCGRNRKLIKAHIIPEGFFSPLREGPTSPEFKEKKKSFNSL
jgi:hypothetical protein